MGTSFFDEEINLFRNVIAKKLECMGITDGKKIIDNETAEPGVFRGFEVKVTLTPVVHPIIGGEEIESKMPVSFEDII